jgi:mitogen-activated protein kinase kinase kinase
MMGEISLLKQLSHPNIVRYLGSEKIGECYFIYLEYMSGGSIASLLKKHGAFAEQIVKNYVRQILTGLYYLHKHKVIHRDIKGANLLVDSDGVVKLADFGCSKRLERSQSQEDMLTSLKGSVPWMAPEVIRQVRYGRKIDIWSLGCSVIEMLSASHPWGEMENHLAGMMKIALSSELPEFPEHISE